MQRELLRHEKGVVEKEKKLDFFWEGSSIMQKKGLEEPNSMWNIYLNKKSYDLEIKKNACIARWRHSQTYMKWSGRAKKFEGKLVVWRSKT